MKKNNRYNWRFIAGSIVWVLVLAALGYWLFGNASEERSGMTRQIAKFIASGRTGVELELEGECSVRIFDPIFARDENGKLIQIGAIDRVVSAESVSQKIEKAEWAHAEFFSNAPTLTQGHTLTYYQTPQSMDFVIQTMLPPEKRKQIAALITKAYAEHHEVIFSKLRPILESGLQEAGLVIQQEFRKSIERHEEELEAVGARYQRELVEAKLIPLINREIWPIVRKESEPLLNKVGEKIWKEASVWRFGWAFLYDASPLPRRDLAKKEFSRFAESKAMPIITAHIPEFIAVQQRVLAKVSQNEKVIAVVKQSLKDAADDSELQRLALSILQDVFVENNRLKEVVNKHWTSPEAQALLEIADQRLEPTVVKIGELMFGNPKKTVTPEFARVLRAKVLMKDHRWFLLEKKNDNDEPIKSKSMRVVIGGPSELNPFYFPTNETLEKQTNNKGSD